jgi:hypothetical protein
MKRGVPYKHVEGERDMCGYAIGGFPVFYDRACDTIAAARGVLWNRHIVVGTSWFYLSPEEQQAVLWHEVGHLKHFHLLRRLLWVPLFWSRIAHRVGVKHELQADAAAARAGFGEGMLRFISRHHNGHPADFYPDLGVRVQHLQQRIKEKQNETAA